MNLFCGFVVHGIECLSNKPHVFNIDLCTKSSIITYNVL